MTEDRIDAVYAEARGHRKRTSLQLRLCADARDCLFTYVADEN